MQSRPSRRAKGRPTRPRDAASLIVIRDGHAGREVLMGRRRSKTRFVPGYYVFPGGTVDAGDRRARPASPLHPDVSRMLGVGGSEAKARALAMAAVRETFEETGLIVGENGDIGPVGSESWAELGRSGMAPALRRLDYVGRAITPSFSPIRYHARFFMVNAKFAHGSLRRDGELLDLHWVPLTEAKRLPLVDVTEFMLDYITHVFLAPPEARFGKPLFAYRNDDPYTRYIGGLAPVGITIVKDRTGLK